MPDQNERSAVIPTDPETLYDAWIDGERHAAMTGAGASSTPEVGGAFTAWGGFITGTWEALERPGRIVMNWRTSVFPADAPHSHVEVLLAADEGGTRVTVRHSNMPDGQGKDYYQGWLEKYFEPLTAHFGG